MAGLSQELIDAAIAEGYKSPYNGSHHGAVLLLKSGHIIGGYNHGFIHAERHAIMKAGSRAYNADMLVVRVRHDRIGRRKKIMSLAMSKPCDHCMKLVDKYSLKVWYSNSNGIIEKL